MSQYPQHPHYSAPGRPGQPGNPGQWHPGPPQGYGPPVPPPAKGNKGARWVIVAVVVAVVVAAGAGGAWFWLRAGGAGEGLAAEAGTQLTRTVEEYFPEDWKPEGEEIAMAVGSWVDGRWWTDDHLVREMPGEVVAYKISDGSVAWRIPVAGNGSCRSSREMTPEGHVAVLRGDGMGRKAVKGCHQLTLVDITAGKELWTVELDQVGGEYANSLSQPVISGGLVHVSNGKGSQTRGLADGSPSDLKAEPTGCAATDHLGVDGVLVSWLRCRSGDEILWVLAGYDENVKPLWGWLHPEKGRKPALTGVLSVDPLTVVVYNGTKGQDIWRVEPGKGTPDAPGTHRVLLSIIAGENISLPCPTYGRSTGPSVCTAVVVGDDVLYLQSNPNGPSSRFHGIVAVDLDTGAERWHARAEGELSLSAITVDDGKLIAFQAQADLSLAKDLGHESPGVVVTVDPGNGGLTALAALPLVERGQTLETLVERGEYGTDTIEWHDGTLAILAPAVVVTSEGVGGGPGSFAGLVYS